MIPKLIFSLCFFSMVLAQTAPFSFGLERGVQVLVFVAPNCAACEALAKIENLPITFVGREASLPYKRYKQDKNDLLARSLRVQQAPTLLVLMDGWEVKRLSGKINPSPKTLNLLIEAAEAGLIGPSYAMPLQIGQMAPEPYHSYSGMLVFGRESCVWCEKEKELLNKLCQSGHPLQMIYSDGKWAEACMGELNEQLFATFGIPGTPTHVYLRQGRVMWIGVGYYSDLDQIHQALGAMEVVK
jgi:thiol-disulfide isomerase/thioredoxin